MNNIAASPERSLVTVLVVDTVGSTAHIADCDPDDAQHFLDLIFEQILKAVNAAGGHLVSYAGDGGVAVFGWPDSQEDHAEKACMAAWHIMNASSAPIEGPDGRPVRYRIGIHSGLVGLRRIDYGGGNRLDTVGGTVHLASALQKSAPHNGIVISSHSLDLCRNRPGVEKFRKIPVLGKVGAEAYLMTGYPKDEAEPDQFAVPLVGRKEELALLEQSLPAAASPFAAVAVVGEPGIGKSRLLSEAVRRASDRDVNILRFHGASNKKTTPFALMQSLLADAIRGAGTNIRELSLRLADGSFLQREDCEALERVMVGDAAHGGTSSYRPTQRQISRVLLEVFLQLNRDKPTLVVVEDYHLVDLESRDCLDQLADRYAPSGISLFLSSRPEAAEGARKFATVFLALEPLPGTEMFALAKSLQRHQDMPSKALWRAVEKADGIPFVLEQIILSADPKTPDSFDVLPLTVQSLIHARLNKLSPEAKRVLQTISILGEQTDRTVLDELLGMAPAALGAALEELVGLAFIHTPQGASVRFRHAIIAEACATTVPSARRRELHKNAMRAIAAAHADLRNKHEMLAYHAEQAGEFADALKYLWQAGLQARRTSAMGSLQLIFARALRCIEQLGPSGETFYVDFVLMASTSMLQIGEFDVVKPHLTKALGFARGQERADKICGALCQLATIRWFEGRYTEGLAFSRDALASARQLNSMPHLFSAQLVNSILLWVTSDMVAAIALQRELQAMLSGDLENARLGATAMPSAMARSFLCWSLMEIGQYEEALGYAAAAIEIAKRGDDPYAECLARSALGNGLLVVGRNDEAVECLKLALELCDRNGYETSRPTVIGNYSVALARMGKTEEAAVISRQWLAGQASHRTGQFERFYALKGAAEAFCSVGAMEESLQIITAAINLAKRIESPCLHLRGLETRIRILNQGSLPNVQLLRDRKRLKQLAEAHGLQPVLVNVGQASTFQAHA